MPQGDIARFIFYEIKDALDRFVRRLQAQERDVHEMRHAAFVLIRLLDELKRSAEGENAIDRITRRDFYRFVARTNHVLVVR